jgi:DNA-binding XRE family transcriptional regulator
MEITYVPKSLHPININNIIHQYENGQSVSSLANKYSCCTTTIYKILHSNNVVLREKRLSKAEIEEIIKLYKEGLPAYKIAKKFSVVNSAILNHLHKNNVVLRPSGLPRKIMIDDEPAIIHEYLDEEKTIKQIANIYGCAPSQIHRVLLKNNVKCRTFIPNNLNKPKTHKKNVYFFDEIDNEEKAYWLGFFASDGTCKYSKITFFLQRTDKDHLKKFLKAIEMEDYEVKDLIKYQNFKKEEKEKEEKKKEEKENEGKKYPQSYIEVSSKHMELMLRKHLSIEGDKIKSYDLKYPCLNEDMHRHFIRGILDGDGCIQNYGKWDIKVDFWGTKHLCETINEILIKELDVNPNVPRKKKGTKSMFEVRWGGRLQVLKILNWLYQDATVYLQRKYEAYKSISTQNYLQEIDSNAGMELRRKREELGLNQAELAKKLGVSQSFISSLEISRYKKIQPKYASLINGFFGFKLF